MLTLAQENVLSVLVNMTKAERQTLKFSVLAVKAGVSFCTVKRAIKVLVRHHLIVVERTCEHGPDAVYSFTVSDRAISITNGIKIAQEFRNVSVPVRMA